MGDISHLFERQFYPKHIFMCSFEDQEIHCKKMPSIYQVYKKIIYWTIGCVLILISYYLLMYEDKDYYIVDSLASLYEANLTKYAKKYTL